MSTYNGWTNYATWRVNLELFDGMNPMDMGWLSEESDGLQNCLQAYAEDLIFIEAPEGKARDYALAFLSYVNWEEIADHMLEEAA